MQMIFLLKIKLIWIMAFLVFTVKIGYKGSGQFTGPFCIPMPDIRVAFLVFVMKIGYTRNIEQ